MAHTATTINRAGAWRPDVYTFAPTDVVPDALILQCFTVAGEIEGDAPVLESPTWTTIGAVHRRG